MQSIPKETKDEAHAELVDLARRFITVYPDELSVFETETYFGFECLIQDDPEEIASTLLNKLGYILEETGYIDYYLIKLKVRLDKPKRKK